MRGVTLFLRISRREAIALVNRRTFRADIQHRGQMILHLVRELVVQECSFDVRLASKLLRQRSVLPL